MYDKRKKRLINELDQLYGLIGSWVTPIPEDVAEDVSAHIKEAESYYKMMLASIKAAQAESQ